MNRVGGALLGRGMSLWPEGVAVPGRKRRIVENVDFCETAGGCRMKPKMRMDGIIELVVCPYRGAGGGKKT